jgi:hypothetical protein
MNVRVYERATVAGEVDADDILCAMHFVGDDVVVHTDVVNQTWSSPTIQPIVGDIVA